MKYCGKRDNSFNEIIMQIQFIGITKKKKKVWLMDALGIIKKKKLLSFIFIVFSKNAKIIGESLHEYL